MIRLVIGFAMIFGLSSISDAQQDFPKTGRLSVDAKSNIFWAGQERFPSDGLAPRIIVIPSGKNRYIEFSVTGETDCGLGIKAGPDGGTCGQRTNVESSIQTGISGLIHDTKTMFLTGVFLGDEPPPGFPAPKFNYTNGERIAVPNHVTFIIGDGLSGTGQGERLRFPVPPNANRLSLGFVDGSGGKTVEGIPGGYSNNTGSLEVQFRIEGELGQAAPEGPDAMVSIPRVSVAEPPQDPPVQVQEPIRLASDPPPSMVSTPMVRVPRACATDIPISSWSGCSGVFFDSVSGSTYSGEFLNGQYHGVGALRGRHGIYIGGFDTGRFDGLGIFTTADGRRYVGQFVAGSMSGFGRLLDTQGGELFSGQFVGGLPQASEALMPRPLLPKRPEIPIPPRQPYP